MGTDDRLVLASKLVDKVKETLAHSGVDRVRHGRVVLREDANALYSLVNRWEDGDGF